jgi:hypothetical protein
VALNTSRWGARFRREVGGGSPNSALTPLVAKALAEALVEAEGFHDLPAGGMGGVCGACPSLRG